MKFSYTALNTENQKLTGVLDAGSIDSAKEELHKMGLSIIIITPISEEEFQRLQSEKKETAPEGILTFSFEASDLTGKVINGTIDARDIYSAYKRLVTEYKFKINELYPSNANDAEKASLKNKLPEWGKQLEDEGYVVEAIGGVKGELEESEGAIDKQIVGEIDRFIINAKKVIKEHADKFSGLFMQQIDKTLGELERIRTSNNVKHICEISNELYELISHPDNLPPEGLEGDKKYQNILASMKDTGLIRGDFDIYKKAVGLKKIQSAFGIFRKLFGKEKTAGLPDEFEKKPSPISMFLKKFIKKSSARKGKEKEVKKTGIALIIKVFLAYLTASNPILRQARKQELKEVINDWKRTKAEKSSPRAVGENGKQIKPGEKGALEEQVAEEEEEITEKKSKWDFSPIFAEIDSFIAWLLFFYMCYFFLVDFSLEKDIGLSRDFIIKTLKTPLILDITIFLLFTHFILKIKSGFFRNNFIGSAFLIFFGLGLYFMIIINF